MIRFACTCSTVMEVPDDRAGTSLQCPLCRKLVDVPTLSDLASLTEEGTYRIDELEVPDEPERLAELQRAFAPTRVDAHGNEIDLRLRPDDPGNEPMTEDDVLEVIEDARPTPPKYDPVTGELIRPMALKNEPVKHDPSTIPMAQAVINYASGATIAKFSGWKIIPELFRFQNVFVMFIIFCVHVLLQVMMFPMVMGMWIVTPGFIFLIGALIAHYANVVNDIGPDNRDELPRPGRDLGWSDDLWGPFVNFALAAGVCYGAIAFVAYVPPALRLAFVGTVFIIGTVAFPAIFLTAATSGTIFNLSPDRVLRVIGTMGVSYFAAVALWVITLIVYLPGITGSLTMLFPLLTGSGLSPLGRMHPVLRFLFDVPVVISFPLLILGIVLMHGFCWYLGLAYREHNESFNWLLQRHHRKVDTIRPAKLKKAPAVAAPVKPPPIASANPQPARSAEHRGG